ncbi:hypothetical protein L4C33_17835, partial [Vibrio makurazakiensis]|uniref:hypothetical protein n=1 Tax=Vibrio makurazakiensis TaxID=2910250 RepID=UPI003D0EC054
MELKQLTDAECWGIATDFMDNLMSASTEINHAKHCRDFSPRMKAIVTEMYLEEVCKVYQAEKGFFAARKPIAIFRRPDSVAFIWKQEFTIAQGEFVAEMVLIEQDGKY